jgi:hypothetical protein
LSVITTNTDDLKERLSIGVVTLIAARAGCMVMEPPLDRNSTDAIIGPASGKKVQIDAQLKSTVDLKSNGSNFDFDLKVKNYNDLREVHVSSPQILVVLDLHKSDSRWLDLSTGGIVLQRRAYWLSLKGAPPTKNKKTVRVKIPKKQVFTPEVLVQLLNDHYTSLLQGTGS